MTGLSHIAFIMDGNRRWAKKRGLPIAMGHKKGAETLIEVAKGAKKIGLKYMTVYAFSTENWQREKAEVDALMDLLRHYLDTSFKELQENDVRIRFIGERDMLAEDIVAKMDKIEADTRDNKSVTLCVALSYGSRQEIIAATKKIAEKVCCGELAVDDINEKIISENLYTADIPEPDLLIRTSGEMRVSNYLLWQLAYTEFYFSATLWPDFSVKELEEIIENYKTRERRYGKS
ncbi:MAG: isoprenyl transferase [Alphaproteobacteria bacterium]|nr:isoprenyl transferase [Alphaproteobacteria bacterium]